MNLTNTKELLHQYLISNKIFGNYTYGGEDQFAKTFFLNDQMIRITTSFKEYESAKFFLENPKVIIADYYQVDWVDGVGYIRTEKITQIDPIKDIELIKDWHHILSSDTTEIFDKKMEDFRIKLFDLKEEFDLDFRDLHWTNCGYNINEDLRYFFILLSDL